jgi:hypothetical protein
MLQMLTTVKTLMWFVRILPLLCVVSVKKMWVRVEYPRTRIGNSAEFCRLQEIIRTHKLTAIAPTLGVDIFSSSGKVALVDGRKGQQQIRSCSEVSWVIGSIQATGTTAGPEKTDCVARCQPGFGTRESGDRAKVVAVHASTLLALSQERAARA